MNKTQKKIEKANTAYFQSLADTRASLYQLKISFFAIFIGGIPSIFIHNEMVLGRDEYIAPFYLFLSLLIISGFMFIASLFPSLLFRFQVFFSFVLVLLPLIVLIFAFGLGYMMAIYNDFDEEIISTGPYTYFILFLGLATALISLIVHIHNLRSRLKVGFSKERTNKNFLSALPDYRLNTFWIIFASVVFVPVILGILAFSVNIVGILTMLLISVTLTQPIVEFSYLAYLKTQDKKYWEEEFEEEEKTPKEKGACLFLLLKWLYFIVTFLLFSYLGSESNTQIDLDNLIVKNILRLIALSWFVLLALWVLKKVKAFIKSRKLRKENKK